MVDAGFEELNFDEDELVVEALEFAEEAVDEGEGVVVGLLRHVQGDQPGFEVLAQEAAALGGGPFYAGFGDGDLRVGRVGDFVEEVEERADWSVLALWSWGRFVHCLPSLAVFALANDDRTVRLVVIRLTSSSVFLLM